MVRFPRVDAGQHGVQAASQVCHGSVIDRL
jgi:hypothetical protein